MQVDTTYPANLEHRIHTRLTDLFQIRYPIIQGGMIWVAGWRLAVAVSRAGGLGLIGAGSMTPDLLREHIRKARRAWDGALGVNIPLMKEDAAELARVTVEEGIRIVFTSAGNPGKFTDYFHSQGMLVAQVVPSLALARKAVERGVDVIVGEGAEAGGHNGFEEIPTFPLIRRLAENLEAPIIAAGGIRDGAGMAAAFALGAEGVQVGTRFACSVESSASEIYKQRIIEAVEPATALILKKLSPTRMLRGEIAARIAEMEAKGASREELSAFLGRGRARRGLFEGDDEKGYMEAGEVAADIHSVETAAEIVEDFIKGFELCLARLGRYRSDKKKQNQEDAPEKQTRM